MVPAVGGDCRAFFCAPDSAYPTVRPSEWRLHVASIQTGETR
jgi:hypothetical protein